MSHLLLGRDVISKNQGGCSNNNAILYNADDHEGHCGQTFQRGCDDEIQGKSV